MFHNDSGLYVSVTRARGGRGKRLLYYNMALACVVLYIVKYGLAQYARVMLSRRSIKNRPTQLEWCAENLVGTTLHDLRARHCYKKSSRRIGQIPCN